MPASPSIDLVRYAAPLDVEVIRFSELRRRALEGGWRLAPHRVDFCHLIAVTSGDLEHLVDFVPVRCKAGSWLVVKAGQVHAFDFSSSWEGWLVVFKPEALPAHHSSKQTANILGIFESLPTLLQPTAPEHHAALGAALAVASQMAEDARSYAHHANGNLLLGTALLYLLLRLQIFANNSLPTQAATSKTASHRFERFKKLVESELRTHQPIGHYASRLGCSEKSLNRAVLELIGVTAKTYLSQRIALEAKRLLVHTTQPVGAIGIDLGFDEATNFVKFFKREAGMLPMAFRQLYAKGTG